MVQEPESQKYQITTAEREQMERLESETTKKQFEELGNRINELIMILKERTPLKEILNCIHKTLNIIAKKLER